jgi:hypothetical protein
MRLSYYAMTACDALLLAQSIVYSPYLGHACARVFQASLNDCYPFYHIIVFIGMEPTSSVKGVNP